MDLPAVEELASADLTALDGWREGDAWLAGGTWLFSEPQPAVRRLLDLTALGWPALVERPEGLEIAATCTLAELAAYRPPPQWPATTLLQPCCRALLGSFKVCNAATVGGNLCLGLPAGPMIALAVALDGICEVWGAGGRTHRVAAIDFVTGPSETVLAPGELLRSVTLPATALSHRTALRQMALSPLGRSAALLIGRSGTGRFVLTVTGAVSRPVTLTLPETATAAQLADALTEAHLEPYDDPHGDPRWRSHLIGLLGEQIRAQLAGGEPLR
jgi:CO/xanthine dehydrogenase FAD-binding subunit